MDYGNRHFGYYFRKNIACFCYFDLIKFTLRKVWLMIVNCRRICLNWIISLYVDIVSIKNPRGFLTFFFLILLERFTSVHICFCHHI